MENLEKKKKEELIVIIYDLQKELEEARDKNTILKQELTQKIEDAKETLETLKARKAIPNTDTDKISALLEIIKLSCQDHCPHGGKVEACKNCSIYLKLEKLKEEHA